jgi:hypothetical protein
MIFGGVILLLGVMFLWYNIKYPIIEEVDYGKGQLKGYLAAFSFMAIGIYLIIKHLSEQ